MYFNRKKKELAEYIYKKEKKKCLLGDNGLLILDMFVVKTHKYLTECLRTSFN